MLKPIKLDAALRINFSSEGLARVPHFVVINHILSLKIFNNGSAKTI